MPLRISDGDNPHRPPCVSGARQKRVECAFRMEDPVAIAVAEHRHYIEPDLKVALRVPGEKGACSPDEPRLLGAGHHAVPVRLDRFRPGLHLDDDEPGAIPGNEVHLQLSDAPIPGEDFPALAHHVIQSHRLAPSPEALPLCFHGANLQPCAPLPCYFRGRMCLRLPSLCPRFGMLCAALVLLGAQPVLAQPGSRAMQRAIGYVKAPEADAKWYAHWGYHRAQYGRSDLRLVGPGIDLTLHDIRATDMPAPFDPKVHLNPAAFTIPQFNARIGRRVRDSQRGALWISAGWDHLKYKVPHTVHEASGTVEGVSYNRSDFDWAWRDFNFEHSDGLNFIRLAVERDVEFGRAGRTRQTWDTANRKFRWGLQGAGSLGLVLCATDVRWQGVRTKHFWHVSGAGASASAGLWFQWGRLRALARVQGGFLSVGNSRFLASSDLSGETPVVEGPAAQQLDASYARHAMTFLERGVTLAYLFGRRGHAQADERVRIAPSR